jgi:hypothetical protein
VKLRRAGHITMYGQRQSAGRSKSLRGPYVARPRSIPSSSQSLSMWGLHFPDLWSGTPEVSVLFKCHLWTYVPSIVLGVVAPYSGEGGVGVCRERSIWCFIIYIIYIYIVTRF